MLIAGVRLSIGMSLKINLKTSIVILLFSLSMLKAGKYAGEFLLINPDARSVALGGCGVSGSQSQSSFIINPANLADLSTINISTLYSTMYGDVRNPLAYYHHIGLSVPISIEGLVFGLNWVRLGVDNIPYFPNYSDVERYNQIEAHGGQPGDNLGKTFFSDREDAIFFSIAKKFPFKVNLGWDYFSFPVVMNVGFNTKFLDLKLADSKASGIGFDVGLNFAVDYNKLFGLTDWKPFRFGFVMTDFNRTGISWTQNAQDAIPLRYKGGLELPLVIKKWKTEISSYYDIVYDEYSTENRLGLEINYDQSYALRVGSADGEITAGTGISIAGFSLDYAYKHAELGAVNKIGLGYKF